jgi:uncharacterized protein
MLALDAATIAIAAGAALAGGAVNAIAGGGSLITFPTLVALGLPPVVANVTNSVALTPGYLGATIAQRRELAGQGRRAVVLLPIAAVAGAGGALLLLAGSERSFTTAVPFLILLASILIGVQEPLRRWIGARGTAGSGREALGAAAIPVGAAAVYGGYFGAGVGVMILAALGVVIGDSLTRLNALKQSISFTVNVAAAVVFALRGPVDWAVVAVMAGGALAGGAIGGALASRIPAAVLRGCIVVIGVAIAGVYFAKL